MSKIIATEFMTLDGYMSGPNDDTNWVLEQSDPEGGKDIEYLYSGAGAIILGRKTYDIWVNYWPNAIPDAANSQARPSEGSEYPVIAQAINSVPKYVFSGSLTEVSWGKYNNANLIHEITPAEVIKIKESSDKYVLLAGSASIFQAFTNLELIDEYNIIIFPVLISKGKLLFENISVKERYRLVKSKIYKNGALSLNYILSTS